MRFLTCLLSICFVFTSIGSFVSPLAHAAISEAYASEQSVDLLRLQKEKNDLEKKYFQATLERSKLENELMDYKDKFVELKSSLPLEISKEKAPLENKLSDLKRELHINKEQLLKTLSESERLRRDIANKEESLFRLQDKHVRLKTDYDHIVRQKKDLSSELKNKEDSLNQAELAKAKLAASITKLEDKLNDLKNGLPKSISDVKRPLEKKIRILNDNLRQRESELALANKQLGETKDQLDQRLTRLSKLSGESQACESQLSTIVLELESKKDEVNLLRKKETDLEKKYYTAERDKIEIERMLADVKEKYQHLDRTVHNTIAQERMPLQEELAVLNNSLRNYEKKTADLEVEIKRLENKLQEKDEKVFTLNSQYKDAQTRFIDAQGSRKKSDNKAHDLIRRVDSLTELLNKAVADNANKEHNLEQQEIRISQLQDDYKRSKEMLEAELAAKSELTEKLNQKNKELIGYQEKIQKLGESVSEYKAQASDSKKRLREKQSKLTEPLQQKIHMLKMKIEEKDSLIGSLTQRLDDTTQELGSKMAKTEQLKNREQKAEENLILAQQKNSALKLDLDMIKEQKLSAESNLVAHERDRLDMEQKLISLNKELESLKSNAQKELGQQTSELQEKVKSLTEEKQSYDKRISKLNTDLGVCKEKLAVHQGLILESEKTLDQNEETISSMRTAMREKDTENKNLMAKIISLNEELNTVQKDLSLKKAEIARYKERLYFLEQNQDYLRSELDKESSARGTINSSLKEKEDALAQVQESEKRLSQELESLENKLSSMKNSLAQKVAVAKEPLQAKILELAADLKYEDERIAGAEKRYSEIKQKIEEKTRSVLRLQRKLSPYDEALGQTSHEKSQREIELNNVFEEKQALEAQVAGLKDDYKALQRELDDAKKEQKKRGLKYSRPQEPLFATVDNPVETDAGRILEPLQEKINGLAIKVQARSDELQNLYAEHKNIQAKYKEKKVTLERLADETVLYNDALGQTKKEILRLNADIKKLAQERLNLKAELEQMTKEAGIKRTELESLKVKHVEVESSLLDQVAQTRNLLQKKVETLNLQQKDYQKTILSMTGEAEILRKQMQEKDIQIAAHEKRLNIELQAHEKLEQEFKEQQVKLRALEEEKGAFEEQLSSLDKQAIDKDSDIEMLKERIAALQKDHNRFAQLIKRNSSEKEYLTRELIGKTENLSLAQEDQLVYVAKIEDLENKIFDLRSSLDETLAKARKPLQEQIATLTQDLREKTHASADSSAKVRELEILLQQRNKENSRMAIDVSEAQLRLDKTRETLQLRIQELDGLRSHKLSMEKQLFQVQVDHDELLKSNAKTNADYQLLKADFKAAVEKQTDELNSRLASLQTKHDSLILSKKETESQIEKLSKDIDLLDRQNSELLEKIALKDYKIVQVEKTVEEIKLENTSLQGQIKALNLELNQAHKSETKYQKDFTELRQEKNTLLNEQAQLKAIIEKRGGAKDDLKKELTLKTKQLAQIQEENLQAQKRVNQLNQKLARTDSVLADKLARLQAKNDQESTKLNKKLSDRQEMLNELTAKIESLQTELTVAKTNESDTLRDFGKLQKKLALANKEIATRSKESQELLSQLASYEKTVDSLEKDNVALRFELKSHETRYRALEKESEQKLQQVRMPLEKEISRLKHDLSELEIVYRKLKEDMPALTQKLVSNERLAIDCERDLQGNVKERTRLLERIAKLESDALNFKAKTKSSEEKLRTDYQEKLSQYTSESKELSTQLKASRKEIDFIQKELDAKNTSLADLTSKLAEVQDSNLSMKQKLLERQSTIGTIQKDCDQRLGMAKSNLNSELKTLRAQLIDKDAKVKLLADHIAENKKIVRSLKGEMKLFIEQSASQNEAYKKSQRDLKAALERNSIIDCSEEEVVVRNAELTRMVAKLNDQIDQLRSSNMDKENIINARDNEITGLHNDQKELTEFLRKEIQARKNNIKELMNKTNALNEVKRQQKVLIEKLKAVQEINN